MKVAQVLLIVGILWHQQLKNLQKTPAKPAAVKWNISWFTNAFSEKFQPFLKRSESMMM
jgi:hypothetical protein